MNKKKPTTQKSCALNIMRVESGTTTQYEARIFIFSTSFCVYCITFLLLTNTSI